MWFLSARKTKRKVGAFSGRGTFRLCLEALEDRCLLNAGTLDPTIGNGAGYVIQQISPYGGSGGGAGVLLQPNGDIIVAGNAVNSSGVHNFYAERFNPDGSLDTSFGNGGMAQASLPPGATGFTIALYPQAGTANDGKIVLEACYDPPSGSLAEQIVERFNTDGSLDTSFGNGGEAITTFPTITRIDGSSVVVTPGGQIVALSSDNVSNHFELARYNSNGSLDTTFGQGGQVITYVPNAAAESQMFDRLLQQPDGELLVTSSAGGVSVSNGSTWDLYDFNANGTPNTSFGSQGLVTTPVAGASTTAALYYNAGPTNDGQIILTGSTLQTGAPTTLVRYNANGSLDSTFGVGGIAQSLLTNFSANAEVIDAYGRIVITGYNFTSSHVSELVRCNDNGTLDSSFGNGGVVTETFGSTYDSGNGVAIYPTAGTPYDGDIVQAGGFGGNGTIFVARYLAQATSPYFIVTGPTSVTAGSAATFTISVLNPDGSADTNYSGTVHITSSDPQASLPANFTLTGGTATFTVTLKTAGVQSLTATDTVTSGITGSDASISVTPAAASRFILSAPSSVNSGSKFSLTVTVEDAYGNVVTGYVGTVHFTSSDSTATLPANYTFTAADAGVHTFTNKAILKKKGRQTITVTDTLNSALTVTDSINVD